MAQAVSWTGGVAVIDAGKCWKCKCQIMLPDELYHAAKRSPDIAIFRGYGHAGVFSEQPTEADTLRLERDRLKQQIAQKDDEIRAANSRAAEQMDRAAKAEKSRARLMKRSVSGVCPCCTRTFQNVQRHMKSKHPNIVPLAQKQA